MDTPTLIAVVGGSGIVGGLIFVARAVLGWSKAMQDHKDLIATLRLDLTKELATQWEKTRQLVDNKLAEHRSNCVAREDTGVRRRPEPVD